MKKLIILLLGLMPIMAAYTQTPVVETQGISNCGTMGGGIITIITDPAYGPYSFILEQKNGPTETNYNQLVGPQDNNVFSGLNVGDYRITAIDGNGCEWGGQKFYYNSTSEEYRECLATITNRSGLYLADCPDDDGTMPSRDNCGGDIWDSPSIRNCFYNQAGNPTYQETIDWDCEFSWADGVNTDFDAEHYYRQSVFQLWEGEQGGETVIKQYPNRLTITIHNMDCADYIEEDSGLRLVPYWTFARTGEIVPGHWWKDYLVAETGEDTNKDIFMMGNCLDFHASHLPPEFTEDYMEDFTITNCLREVIPDIPAGESHEMSFDWHPPNPVVVADYPNGFFNNPDFEGHPQLCILVQIEEDSGEAIHEMIEYDNGPVSQFVKRFNDLSTKNLVYLTRNWDAIIEKYELEPATTPEPFGEHNLYLEEDAPEPVPATAITSHSYQEAADIKIVMVNNVLEHPAMVDINFIKETPNSAITEYGDLFIHLDAVLWTKAETAGFKGEGYEVHDAENNILILTEGNGFKIEDVAYEPTEKRFIGFEYREHPAKKPIDLEQPIVIDYLLSHTATYMREGMWETTKDGGSAVKFRSIINSEDISGRDFTAANRFELSPNPTDAISTLSFSIDENMATIYIHVLDNQGSLVKTLESNTEVNKGVQKRAIDMSGFTAGIYFVKLTVNEEVFTQKLIVY